jgi:hypothetical protein
MLAEALGMTVAQMTESISNREYLAWAAFYNWREAKREFAAKRQQRAR